jgi:hypothetical protein
MGHLARCRMRDPRRIQGPAAYRMPKNEDTLVGKDKSDRDGDGFATLRDTSFYAVHMVAVRRLKFRLLRSRQRSPDAIFESYNKCASRTDVRDCLGNCSGTRVWERLREVISEVFPLDQLVSGAHQITFVSLLCDTQSSGFAALQSGSERV